MPNEDHETGKIIYYEAAENSALLQTDILKL